MYSLTRGEEDMMTDVQLDTRRGGHVDRCTAWQMHGFDDEQRQCGVGLNRKWLFHFRTN